MTTDESTALYENPWNPSNDLLYKCYHENDWENRICTALVIEEQEEILYHVANLFGDAQGLSSLCGILEKVFLPTLLEKNELPDNISREGIETLKQLMEKRRDHLEKLQDMFFQDIYPQSWAKDGVMERVMGTQKWLWKPLILMCHRNKDRKPSGSLSSVALMNGMFQVSAIVSVIQSLLSTIMEDDLCSQTLCWFENNKAYWKLWVDWSQSFYDDLAQWQQGYDKKGIWNSAHGKVCRVLRPFSSFFPTLSLFVEDRITDKAGMVRILVYHSFLFLHWVKIFVRCLYRQKHQASADDLNAAYRAYTVFMEGWIENLPQAGITNIGYHQSILWGDAFLEHRPLPPLLFLWKNVSNPRKLEQLKNFFSTATYQRTVLIDLIEKMYAHNDIFMQMIRDLGATNRHFYKIIQMMDFQ